jgi:hypothetical protein
MLFSGIHAWVYLYCLRHKKCLDCFATNNQSLSYDEEHAELSCVTHGGVVSHQYGCLIVIRIDAVIACDMTGVKWKVAHDGSYGFGASVIGSRMVVKHNFPCGYTMNMIIILVA